MRCACKLMLWLGIIFALNRFFKLINEDTLRTADFPSAHWPCIMINKQFKNLY